MASDAPQRAERSPDLGGQVIVDPWFAYHAPVAEHVRKMRSTRPCFAWWWCERGSARVQLVGSPGESRVEAGQWMLIPPAITRDHDIEPGTVFISISFHAFWPSGLPLLQLPGPLIANGANHQPLRQRALDVCEAKAALGRTKRASPRGKPNSLELCRLHGQLYLFAADLFDRAAAMGCELGKPGTGDNRLDWVLKEMHRDLRAGPLPLAQWSRAVGLSRSQLDRLSRRLLGMSLRDRRDQWLLDELRRQLTTGGASIKELAAIHGFVDSSHFCRWVRQHTGRSPMQIREEYMT